MVEVNDMWGNDAYCLQALEAHLTGAWQSNETLLGHLEDEITHGQWL